MHKIPVGETISGAYSFGFKRFLSVLGVVWFPYLVLIVLCAGLVMLVAPDLAGQLAHGQFDPVNMMRAARFLNIIWLLLFIVSSMVQVGLQRAALGMHPKPVFFFFSLGVEVWLMAAARFLAGLIIVVIVLLTAGVTVAIWFAAGTISAHAVVNVIRAVAIIAAVCWVIYMMVRLMFLLPAVVVAENELGLGRSWTLGGGNFWRMVVIAIAVFVPVSIGFSMVEGAIAGPVMFQMDFLKHLDHMTPQDFFNSFAQQFRVVGPVFAVIVLIRSILFDGLFAGMVASAYRGIVPPK
jgi:hypothetical protein